MYCIEESACAIVGTFRRRHSDSGIAPLDPHVTTLTVQHLVESLLSIIRCGKLQ